MSQIEAFKQANGQGTLWQTDGLPARALPSVDARQVALEALRSYLGSLVFYKKNGTGQTLPFAIPPENIFIEWPDSEEMVDNGDDDFPRIAFLPGEPQDHDFIGNVAFGDESTANVYAPGTMIYLWAEHVETMTMLVWARDVWERTALIAGLEVAFNPVQEVSGLWLKLLNYFNYTAEYSMESGGRREEADAIRNRRTAEFQITLRVPKAMLVNVPDLQPSFVI